MDRERRAVVAAVADDLTQSDSANASSLSSSSSGYSATALHRPLISALECLAQLLHPAFVASPASSLASLPSAAAAAAAALPIVPFDLVVDAAAAVTALMYNEAADLPLPPAALLAAQHVIRRVAPMLEAVLSEPVGTSSFSASGSSASASSASASGSNANASSASARGSGTVPNQADQAADAIAGDSSRQRRLKAASLLLPLIEAASVPLRLCVSAVHPDFQQAATGAFELGATRETGFGF
jgi:hypothetical protein